jgi:hypothetical protein
MPPQTPSPVPVPPHSRGILYLIVLAVCGTLVVVSIALTAGVYYGYVWLAPLQSAYDEGFGAERATVPGDLEQIIQGLEETATTGSSSIPVMVESQGNTTNVYLGGGDVRDGIYSLVGRGTSQLTSYTGTVEIRRRTGNVYDLTWRIGGTQEQWGVGIFREGILSVGYYDQTGGSVQDAGVVSFVVQRGYLEGEWTSLQGGGTGIEQLEWLSQ